jgi:hypothetical protein
MSSNRGIHGLSLALVGLSFIPAASRGAEPLSAPASNTAAQGAIETGAPEFQLELISTEGKLKVPGRDGRAVLPQGRYILMRCVVTRRDRQGRRWEATFDPGVHPWFDVGAKPVRLDFGGKLTAVTTADLHGATATIATRFLTNSGVLKALTVDGVPPPEPALRVVDAKGRTVAHLTQKYACCFISRAAWQTSPDLRGDFRIVPDEDFGPFTIAAVRPATLTLTDATAAGAPLPYARMGQEAPNFSLARIGGGRGLSPLSLRGRPLILMFSCGCVPCQEVAHRLAAEPGLEKRAEVAVIVISREAASDDSVRQFRESSGYQGPMAVDDGSVAPAYQALHCPKLWLLDAMGVARWTGGGDSDPRTPAALFDALMRELAGLDPARQANR